MNLSPTSTTAAKAATVSLNVEEMVYGPVDVRTWICGLRTSKGSEQWMVLEVILTDGALCDPAAGGSVIFEVGELLDLCNGVRFKNRIEIDSGIL